MKKGNLTREQAIEIVGLAAVEEAEEASNWDFSNRVGYNGSCHGDDEVEFEVQTACKDKDGRDVVLTVYCYQDAIAVDGAADDLGMLDWDIEGYDVQ